MLGRRFDAHCHLFDFDYLVLEGGQMLWDEICGRYPTRRIKAEKEGKTLRDYFDWLKELVGALHGPEERNLDEVLGAVRSTWKDGDACAIPLMMDIYYLFDAPLLLGDDFANEGFVARNAPIPADAEKRLGQALVQLELPQDWADKIQRGLGDVRTEKASGPFDTMGFRHHQRALRRLAVNRPGQIYPFLAVDPRRRGAVQAIIDGTAEVGRDGPFYGVKLYPRLGYHPAHAELEPLYAWCAKNGIPVTTHCGPGGFPPWNDAHASLGFPTNYEPILKRHPGLRINFAHFGSRRDEWASAVLALLKEFPGQAFSDLSCYAGDGDPAAFRAAHLSAWPLITASTMVGTDYDVMGLTEAGRSLASYYAQFMADIPQADMEAMSSRVVEKFLGLS